MSDDRTADRAAWTRTIDTLEATFRSLSELGASLDEQQWKAATDLPAWSVQDNLSHLVGIERMLHGLPATEHRAGETAHVRNPIGEVNEHEVDVRRSRTGAEVLAEWDEITAQRLAVLRSVDDAYFDAPAMTPTGPGTVADFLHIRVLDCWVHEQDMRRAVGLPGHDDGAAAEHTIDRLIRTIPIVVGKRAATPEGATVVIELTGPVHRTIATTVIDGRAQLRPDVPAVVFATLTMDSNTFVTLATGRRTATDLAGAVHLSGDVAHAQRVADALNMMI
jgi:uncharacterized protein (TIGR03083 family)